MTKRSQAVHVSGKLSYREQLVAMWTRDPRTTIEEIRRLTGAPKASIVKVRRDLIERGVLVAGGSAF